MNEQTSQDSTPDRPAHLPCCPALLGSRREVDHERPNVLQQVVDDAVLVDIHTFGVRRGLHRPRRFHVEPHDARLRGAARLKARMGQLDVGQRHGAHACQEKEGERLREAPERGGKVSPRMEQGENLNPGLVRSITKINPVRSSSD